MKYQFLNDFWNFFFISISGVPRYFTCGRASQCKDFMGTNAVIVVINYFYFDLHSSICSVIRFVGRNRACFTIRLVAIGVFFGCCFGFARLLLCVFICYLYATFSSLVFGLAIISVATSVSWVFL